MLKVLIQKYTDYLITSGNRKKKRQICWQQKQKILLNASEI